MLWDLSYKNKNKLNASTATDVYIIVSQPLRVRGAPTFKTEQMLRYF